MTDNQFNQLFELVTKSVNGIQRLEKGQEEMRADIAELKTGVTELNEGQVKLDKSLQIVEHWRIYTAIGQICARVWRFWKMKKIFLYKLEIG